MTFPKWKILLSVKIEIAVMTVPEMAGDKNVTTFSCGIKGVLNSASVEEY